jgi:hypothetical protein
MGEPGGRVFFVHVMKTGGSTINWHVRSSLGPGEAYPDRELDRLVVDGKLNQADNLSVANMLALPPDRRRRIRLYSGHYPYAAVEQLGEDVATLAILREPVARTISLLRAHGRPGAWGPNPTKVFPMGSWPLERLYEDPSVYEPLVHDHQTKVFAMTPADGCDTFSDVIAVDEGRLELAKENVRSLDVLGVTERWDDLVADVGSRFGWHVPVASRVNVGRTDDDRVASPSLLRRIAEDNAFDVELHRYATELVGSRHR